MSASTKVFSTSSVTGLSRADVQTRSAVIIADIKMVCRLNSKDLSEFGGFVGARLLTASWVKGSVPNPWADGLSSSAPLPDAIYA